MLVNVCYSTPVVAVVDTTSGRIVRVVVDDESIRPVEYCEAAETGAILAPDSPEAMRARDIADSDWPHWTVGF